MTASLRGSFDELAQQRQFLENVINSIRDEIVVLDRDGNVVTANRAARDGQLGEGAEISSSLALETFRTGAPGKRLDVIPTPEGEERHLEVHTYPLRNENGDVFQVILVARDITERTFLEAHLRHSERLASLGLLASGFSHEINNPLGAIATSVDGLRRRTLNGGQLSREAADLLEKTLPRIASQVQRARAITDRLMNVARPPGNTRSLIDVNHAVEDTLAVLSYAIQRAGIVTRKELSERIPPLCDDESRLAQILMNLILNSIQAMSSEGGLLRIATAAENGTVRLDIADTGDGIPANILGKIYEPFFTTKPADKGTGLGLFITHQIVTEMEGTIEVQSEPRRGTLFTVRLPYHRAVTRREH
jgi:signal transduction histidine kinase